MNKFPIAAAFAVLALAGGAVANAKVDLSASANVSGSVIVNPIFGSRPTGTAYPMNVNLNGVSGAARITIIVNRADQEITRRLNALNAMSARVNAMANLSADEKNTLGASIQAQIAAMDDLQGKIGQDASSTSTTTLKADIDSIKASYRIFALVLPQGAIEAASDRVLTIVTMMNDLSAKFSARLSDAANAGNNVSAAQTTLTDFNAKVSDAQTQAQAATSEVASLTPDNGDGTKMQSNIAALKDARAKIVASQQDLIAARADAKQIVDALSGYKVSASASTTVNVSTSAY